VNFRVVTSLVVTLSIEDMVQDMEVMAC